MEKGCQFRGNRFLSVKFPQEHGGICGYDTQLSSFLCLCTQKNTTTYCTEHNVHHVRQGQVVAGIVAGIGVGGMIGGGAIIWYLRRTRPNRPYRLGAVNTT
ncbi:hypothetical protein SUGI_0618660 [Cryptomeria japonica]|nr:hypothetical protein SUGI_0618660 [Cryptomeria japonica]